MTRPIGIACSLIPAAFLLVVGCQRRWVTDDAFINFRIVENLIEGNGLVYNVGERVEAGTSLLWLLVLAFFDWLPNPLSLEMTSVVLGLLLTCVALIVAQRAAFICQTPRVGTALPLGAVVFVSVMPVWDFSTSGLETGLSFFWLASAWLTLVVYSRSPRLRRLVVAGVVISLATTVRPDFGIFGAVFSAVLFYLVGRQPKQMCLAAASLLLLPVGAELFRAGYFATLVPNTALAKSANSLRLDFGIYYLNDLARPYFLFVPFAALLSLLWYQRGTMKSRRNVLVCFAPAGAGLIHASYVVAIGGDYMHGRLLLPALFAVLAPLMTVVVTKQTVISAGVVAIWSALSIFFLRPSYAVSDASYLVSNERQVWVNASQQSGSGTRNPISRFDYGPTGQEVLSAGGLFAVQNGAVSQLGLANRDQPVVALEVLGSAGLRTDSAWVVDRLGLADPIASRLPLRPGSRPGHGKFLSDDWLEGRFAQSQSSNKGQAAEEALGCGELKELVAAVEDPMTKDRFIDNLRGSLVFTTMNIPQDPELARARFCTGRTS